MYSGILKRTAVRDYLDQKIEKEKIEKLKQIINLSPTSMNTQEFSAIFITDHNLKSKISKLNWNQKHIAECPLLIIYCADFNRVNWACEKQNKSCNVDSIEKFTLATVDATIAAGMVGATADELGLSTCYVGGIRNYSDQIANDLNLSSQCTPVLAMTVGYARKINPLRPKVNKVYFEKYDINQVHAELVAYEEVMEKYHQQIFNRPDGWSKATTDGMCGEKLDTSKRLKILKEQFKL